MTLCKALRGIFIAFEGLDGAGLSTHARLLAEKLREVVECRCVAYTKEPSTGPVGRLISQLLRSGGTRQDIFALLYAADRLDHLYVQDVCGFKGVVGAVGEGCIVLTDRYKYCSLVYQTVSDYPRLTPTWVNTVNAFAPPPHILIFIDVPPEIAYRTILDERKAREFFERLEFLREAYRGYKKLMELLEVIPEYCPSSTPAPWISPMHVNPTYLEKLYPRGYCYPAIIQVKAFEDNQRRPLEEVSNDILAATIYIACKLGMMKCDEHYIRELEEKIRTSKHVKVTIRGE